MESGAIWNDADLISFKKHIAVDMYDSDSNYHDLERVLFLQFRWWPGGARWTDPIRDLFI